MFRLSLYVEIRSDYVTDKLALGMLSDAPLATFLGEHPKVRKISFCLDNDGPGRKAAEALMEKYCGLGYEVEDCRRRSRSRTITSGSRRQRGVFPPLCRPKRQCVEKAN